MAMFEAVCPHCGFRDELSSPPQGVHQCEHCGHTFAADESGREHDGARKRAPSLTAEIDADTLCFYPGKLSAVGTVGGPAIVAVIIAAGSWQQGEIGLWSTILLIVMTATAIFGFARLLSGKPVIVVNHQGIFADEGRIRWNDVASLEKWMGGVPIRVKLCVTTIQGHVVRINLSEVNRTPKRALKEIAGKIAVYRPDLTIE